MRRNRALRSGEVGERAAEQWFLNHGWHMVRTQPAIQILGVAPGRRFGTVFTVRMVGRGGVPDYTGYVVSPTVGIYVVTAPIYRACEIKEASGDTMPCSRLDKEQRDFMDGLPAGCAWVGILWTETGKFSMHAYKSKGSYQKPAA